MKQFFGILYSFSLLLLLSACAEKKKGGFLVNVHYSNAAPGKRFILEEIPYGGEARPIFQDSAVAKTASGKLLFKGTGTEQGIYQLVEENGHSILLVNDVEEMTINLDAAKSEDFYTVTGSEASKQLQEFIKQFVEKSNSVNQAFSRLDSIKKLGGSDSLQILLTNTKNQSLKRLTEYVETSIRAADNAALSMFMLGAASRVMPPDKFSKTIEEVIKKYPTHQMLAQVKAGYEAQLAQRTQMEARQRNNSLLGKQVPDFSLPNEEGTQVSIASFEGKYLLVDFWASWCAPCRMENPNVVNAYNKFKTKNFTILGVSLDKQKEAWIKAIKDDQLNWTHISDLQFWNSKAVEVFKFQGIPFNILIDPKGTVIAENLRGEELDKKLGEVLK
jgi:peroxiredoxin